MQEFSQKFSSKNNANTNANTIENIKFQHQKFLNFQHEIEKLGVDYIIIDITDTRQNTEIFLYNLVKYQEIYKYENNIFIFKF